MSNDTSSPTGSGTTTDPDNLAKSVLYGVWDPTMGWIYGQTWHNAGWDNESSAVVETEFFYQHTPYLFNDYARAESLARSAKAQLVTFDVVPCLRRWPHEEQRTTHAHPSAGATEK